VKKNSALIKGPDFAGNVNSNYSYTSTVLKDSKGNNLVIWCIGGNSTEIKVFQGKQAVAEAKLQALDKKLKDKNDLIDTNEAAINKEKAKISAGSIATVIKAELVERRKKLKEDNLEDANFNWTEEANYEKILAAKQNLIDIRFLENDGAGGRIDFKALEVSSAEKKEEDENVAREKKKYEQKLSQVEM